MKSFLDHLKEEVLPTVQVADGGLDISKPAVRAAINAAIAGVVSQPAVTPYVVFNRLSKLLAQYHIVLPKRFLEGDKGVEVFELRQFGHKMGMTDSGEFINEVPSTHYLFLQYGILSPFGITYAKPVVGGMFKVMAKVVDKEELDKLMDMAEITMAEEAEVNQNIAKANAPREEMKDITSDEKKKGNKEAVGASEKKSLDEEDFNAGQVLKNVRDADAAKNPNGPAAMRNKAEDEALERAGKGLARDMKEDKDPCWKGYEMIGMKKKGGRKVPNCVPVEEATDKDRDLSKLADTAMDKGHPVKKLPAGRAQNAVLPKRSMPKGHNIEKGRWSGHGKFGLNKEETQLDELTGKGKLPALKAVYKGDKDYHTRGADYHAARADRAERRGEDSKAERHMDAGYGHEHKAERAEAKSKRASALMVRAKAHADLKSSKAASKSARAEYNEETQIDEISTKLARSFVSKAKDGSRTQGVLRARGKMTGEPYPLVDKKHGNVTVGHASPKVLTKEEQIDELKKSTLASYIKKAHVSGLEAASQGEIAYANKDKAGLRAANKTGEKREQGIERAAGKLAKEETIAEKAPPGAKYERMVKHIKKGYAKDGELTAKEKGIAFATAWKAKNREKGE